MTNEDKIQEIVNSQPFADGNDNYQFMIEWGAKQMANWKDSQMKEALEKEINSANAYYDKELNQNMMYRHIGAISILTILLDIPFPTDKLHMNFVTMD